MTTTDTGHGRTAGPAPALADPEATSRADLANLATLALGFVMATMDATVVNVAGATVKTKLGLSLAGLTWVIDGYVLTFAALLLLSGALAGRLGAKRVYLAGLALFTVASLACGLAPNGASLIGARLVQGSGAALFMPSSLGLLVSVFPQEKKRARMVGLWTAIISTASALGPVIGGVLVSTAGWRSIFLINIPIGVGALLLTARRIPGTPADAGRRVPLPSHIVGVFALVALSFGLIEGGTYGWASASILTAFVAAAVGVLAFVLRERTVATPVIPVALFRDPRFSAANVVGFLLNFALFGGVFLLGIFLQLTRGASVLRAGIELLPMMGVFVIGNLAFARIVGRTGIRRPLIIALATAGLGALVMLTINASMPYALLAVVMAVANLGVGITVPALTAALMQAAGRENANLAGATLTANRQIGALVGVAVTGAILAGVHNPYTAARTTFLAMAVAYLLASFLSWRFIHTDT